MINYETTADMRGAYIGYLINWDAIKQQEIEELQAECKCALCEGRVTSFVWVDDDSRETYCEECAPDSAREIETEKLYDFYGM